MRLPRLLSALLIASLSLPAVAADTCDFQAYANDPDPAGTNVRSGPGTSYPVIGVLKPTTMEGYTFGAEFHVDGFEDGWFRIGDASTGQYGDDTEEVVFKGPGWISVKLVGFEIEDINLLAGPAYDAEPIVTLDGNWSLDKARIQTIHGCEGRFLHVSLADGTGSVATGWVGDLCGSQVTTCP